MRMGKAALGLLGSLLGEQPGGKRRHTSSVTIATEPVSNWEQPVIGFPDGDALTLKEAQFIMGLGTTGAGKTSAFENIAKLYLLQGMGGLVLTEKADEVDTWITYAKKYGRQDDLIIFTPGEHGFNFIQYIYELFTEAAGSGVIQNVVQLFLEIAASKELRAGAAKGESFWSDAYSLMVLNAIYLLTLSRTEITLDELAKIIKSAPTDAEEAASEEWRTTSRCFSYIAFITAQLDPETAEEDLNLTPREMEDFELVVEFWLTTWSNLAPNTRSCISIMFANFAQDFAYGVMADSFCGETTVIPSMSRQGKIIVLNLPKERWYRAGQQAQILWKLCWQKTMKVISGTPVFLWMDEAAGFVDASDSEFLQTARSHQCCYVLLCQTMALFLKELPEKFVYALLENYNTRVFLASGDPTTREYAAKCIAMGIVTHRSMSINNPTPGNNWQGGGSSSQSEHLEFKVRPEAFASLKMGGAVNQYLVGSYVFRVGREFRGTNDNYRQVDWPQLFVEN